MGFQSLINVQFIYRHNPPELNILCFMIIGVLIYQTETKADGNEIIVLDI